ncbi:MAG: VanZ family protein [Pseudomonadota bacterium]
MEKLRTLTNLHVSYSRLGFWFCLIAIVVLSLLPGKIAIGLHFWDKLNHVLAYFVLASLVSYGYTTVSGSEGTKRRILVWQFLALSLLGGLLELGQAVLPGRVVSGGDILANCIGLFFGLQFGGWLVPKLIGKGTRIKPRDHKS